MPNVDKSLSWDGLYQFYTDKGAKFLIKIVESAPNSGVWMVNFVKSNTIEVEPREVFSLMKLIAEGCNEYANQKGINKAIFLMSGGREESLQKSKIFTRWMEDNWNFEIKESQIKIPGTRFEVLNSTPYTISLSRKEKSNKTEITNSSNTISQEIKFCYNCGTPNNSYLFCPSCGTKLKQN